MFAIRRVLDDVVPDDKRALAQAQKLLRERFSAARPDDFELAKKLRDPFEQGFRTIVFVAESRAHRVNGCAVVYHDPLLHFCFLDYLATPARLQGRGIGGALYDRVRQEAKALEDVGIFFECLPDDPASVPDEAHRQANASRLKFYEAFGARPIIGTRYEAPMKPGDLGGPYLMYDDLGLGTPLPREHARQIVRAILEKKYGYLCTPEYIESVVQSFQDDPVLLRPPRYAQAPAVVRARVEKPIALVVSQQHTIHHIRERGYVEAPARIPAILQALEPSPYFQKIDPEPFPEDHILAVHDEEFVSYLRRACAQVPAGQSLYPYVFPIRNAACEVLRTRFAAYALVRPPGHHAERRSFGGFCYFNNAAIAAQYLVPHGKVAILDVDYHHGNGQQDIFYQRSDVLTVSLHGHPNFAYPYFTGFDDEQGAEAGEGYNVNFPLPESLTGPQYLEALQKALEVVRNFQPELLIVSLGFDPAKGDPTGTWLLTPKDFAANGRAIRQLNLPTLFVQEGGYRTRTLGANALAFFSGFSEPLPLPPIAPPPRRRDKIDVGGSRPGILQGMPAQQPHAPREE